MKALLKRLTLWKLQKNIRLYRRIFADSRTPLPAKILLGVALAYFLWPIDLLPDVIPIIGQLDDAILVPILIFVAMKLVPKNVWEEHKRALALR